MSFAVPVLAIMLLCLMLLAGYGEVIDTLRDSDMLVRIRNNGPEGGTVCARGRIRRLLCVFNDGLCEWKRPDDDDHRGRSPAAERKRQ